MAQRQQLAVVGSGISGLTCAHLLGQQHDVMLFESGSWLGGHTHTVEVDGLAVDTGFIVYNDRTYPNFIKLLKLLGVTGQRTQMSFSVCDPAQDLEYNGHGLAGLFAQTRNLYRPEFWRMLKQILRFNRQAKQLIRSGQIPEGSVADYLAKERFSGWMVSHYLLPMGAAIWSCSEQDLAQFPLRFLLRFFHHHGLLDLINRPQWYTVKGGSWRYIDAMVQAGHFQFELNNGVVQLQRDEHGVTVQTQNGQSQRFDQVILACHSDQALALLAAPSEAERQILSAIRYTDNEVVLHRESSVLPKRRRAWASWNARVLAPSAQNRAGMISYNMNILQRLKTDKTYCISLNPEPEIPPEKQLGHYRYAHPQFNELAESAKARRREICGQQRTHYCGAYWYNGFHEDGVRSALDVCVRFGVNL